MHFIVIPFFCLFIDRVDDFIFYRKIRFAVQFIAMHQDGTVIEKSILEAIPRKTLQASINFKTNSGKAVEVIEKSNTTKSVEYDVLAATYFKTEVKEKDIVKVKASLTKQYQAKCKLE